MYIPINDKIELLNFLLKQDIYNNFEVDKLTMQNQFINIETDPVYYEYNTKRNILFGDRTYNLYSHLSKNTTYDSIYIKEKYTATLNVQTNTETTIKHYPKEIIQRFIDNTLGTNGTLGTNSTFNTLSINNTFTYDIKLTANNKSVFDENNELKKFSINFFSLNNESGILLSSVERVKDFNDISSQQWYTYMIGIIQDYFHNIIV